MFAKSCTEREYAPILLYINKKVTLIDDKVMKLKINGKKPCKRIQISEKKLQGFELKIKN